MIKIMGNKMDDHEENKPSSQIRDALMKVLMHGMMAPTQKQLVTNLHTELWNTVLPEGRGLLQECTAGIEDEMMVSLHGRQDHG
jgi:hypothetical protein